MLVLENLDYHSFETLVFQRSTVIATDLLLFFSVLFYSSSLSLGQRNTLLLLILLNPGLIIVDNIHFQYNGMLLALCIVSIALMERGYFLWAAASFTVLLCLKQIFLYASPLYFIYLLRNYCVDSNQFCALKLLKLSSVVVAIFLITFLPILLAMSTTMSFAAASKILLKQLFPFKRGLCHAYWAPNIWALYNLVDRLIFQALHRIGVLMHHPHQSLTRGMIADTTHMVLPNITPATSMALCFTLLLPILWHVWNHPQSTSKPNFAAYFTLTTMAVFMVGWHVHEKAILISLIPLCLHFNNPVFAKGYFALSIPAYYSLFPLLFEPNEQLVTICVYLLHLSFVYLLLREAFSVADAIFCLSSCYLAVLLLMHLGISIYPLLNISIRFPFLPLLLTSCYCSIGILGSWFYLLYHVAATS